MSHKIIYLDDSITIADLVNALRFSAYSVSNTVAPNAFVIRPNPQVLTDAQFERITQLLEDEHER